MKLLLHEELAPLTAHIAFFPTSFEDVWKATLKFRTDAFSKAKFKRTIKAKELSGDLKAVLKGLLPFCNLITRHLIIEGDNGWVAYFNNSLRGDFGAVYSNLPPLLNCDAVTIHLEPRTAKN